MNIGFIGLGNMGGPMAANLAAAGNSVKGFDVAGTSAEGVSVASSAAEAATGVDVLITMLPNGAILRSVADEVIPAMDKGAALLDCSTVDVQSARGGGSMRCSRSSCARRARVWRHWRSLWRHADIHGWRHGRRV